jgi:hypothetical protein
MYMPWIQTLGALKIVDAPPMVEHPRYGAPGFAFALPEWETPGS